MSKSCSRASTDPPGNVCVCVCVNLCVCYACELDVYGCMYLCMPVGIYTHTDASNVHSSLSVCVCVCARVCVCVYVRARVKTQM